MGILILLLATFIHEGGHFALASWLGVKVEELGLGVGPRLISRKVGGVKVSLNLLPLGAYVRASPEESAALPAWKEAVIAAAGPGVNFAFAALALAGVLIARGVGILTSLAIGTKTVLAMVGGLAKELGSLIAAGTVQGGGMLAGAAATSQMAGQVGAGVTVAILSVMLGVFNLLPFPSLDGAKILLAPFRRWRGLRVIEAIGFVCLMALGLWLIGIDLYRWATTGSPLPP